MWLSTLPRQFLAEGGSCVKSASSILARARASNDLLQFHLSQGCAVFEESAVATTSHFAARGSFARVNRFTRAWQHGDRFYRLLLTLAALSVLALVIAIGYELWQSSALAREKFGLDFITTADWDPVAESFGALPFILGTLITAAIALVIAVPVGIGIAIFLAELAPDWLRQPVGFLIELLAAVPSVIYGLWGLFVLAPFLRATLEPARG